MQIIPAQALRSARTCRIRPVRRRDAFELQRFIRGLSAESRYARFMMGIRERQGLGTSLLSDITTIAGDHAIAYFHADVLAENQPMQRAGANIGMADELSS